MHFDESKIYHHRHPLCECPGYSHYNCNLFCEDDGDCAVEVCLGEVPEYALVWLAEEEERSHV